MLDAVSAHASHALKLSEASGAMDSTDRISTLMDGYGLTIKNVGPKSALLFGADACIDPSSQSIRIRRDISPLFRREVLAHELAHAILGHDSFGAVVERTDYVAAYGRNERIERMADNLASILLVTDSDLDEARKACPNFSAAAEFLEITPQMLIRRLTQHRSPITEKPLDKLELLPHQEVAVDCVGDVCIDGGVGTGKTEVLLERLRRIGETSNIGHSRILFVTYLRRHMVYLFERMAQVAPMLAERVNFTTFHDYAADIVLRNAAIAGCLGLPTVVGEGELKVLLKKSFPSVSDDELKRMCTDFRQGLRHDANQTEPWATSLSEQLYELKYIHNGSLGDIASRLMENPSISDDEADRWDGIFVDNYEQLTYAELSVLRLASRRARYGISAASGFSALPYTYRGVSTASSAMWKQECALSCFDFGLQQRIRPNPSIEVIDSENVVLAAVKTVRHLLEWSKSSEKIVVAVRRNAAITPLQAAFAVEFPDLFRHDAGLVHMCKRLYDLIDAGASIDELLDEWWVNFRDCRDDEASHLQSVLANCQMYASHCERLEAVGLPKVSMEAYMESIRPHHQYRDIHLSERIAIQTLHSLSGAEADHMVVITDGLDMASLNLSDNALFDNACARATKTLTLIHAMTDDRRVG